MCSSDLVCHYVWNRHARRRLDRTCRHRIIGCLNLGLAGDSKLSICGKRKIISWSRPAIERTHSSKRDLSVWRIQCRKIGAFASPCETAKLPSRFFPRGFGAHCPRSQNILSGNFLDCAPAHHGAICRQISAPGTGITLALMDRSKTPRYLSSAPMDKSCVRFQMHATPMKFFLAFRRIWQLWIRLAWRPDCFQNFWCAGCKQKACRPL